MRHVRKFCDPFSIWSWNLSPPLEPGWALVAAPRKGSSRRDTKWLRGWVSKGGESQRLPSATTCNPREQRAVHPIHEQTLCGLLLYATAGGWSLAQLPATRCMPCHGLSLMEETDTERSSVLLKVTHPIKQIQEPNSSIGLQTGPPTQEARQYRAAGAAG